MNLRHLKQSVNISLQDPIELEPDFISNLIVKQKIKKNKIL